jgi:glycosyltransferase involved in cell wall biosynthesis
MSNQPKKRILVFIDWYLPGYKAGGPVRSMANMVDHLSDEFDFYIVTRNSEYGETTPYSSVNADCWNDVGSSVKVWYCSAGKPSLLLWRRLIKESGCDVVYINGIYSMFFSLLPLVASKSLSYKRIIVAPRGMLATSAIHVKRGKKVLFLRLARLAGLFRRVTWHVTNIAEANQVQSVLNPKASFVTAANLPRMVVGTSESIEKRVGHLRLCSLARIAPEKNTLYAIESLLGLDESVSVELDLYGQIYDQNYWSQCQEAIGQLPHNITVTYKGFVQPDEVAVTLKNYHALFLPSRGENFGHVILESFMAGRPVIISDQTPWKNLADQKSGWELPLQNKMDFARVINGLAEMTQSGYNEWCKGAWQLGQRVAMDAELVEVYKEMLVGEIVSSQ